MHQAPHRRRRGANGKRRIGRELLELLYHEPQPTARAGQLESAAPGPERTEAARSQGDDASDSIPAKILGGNGLVLVLQPGLGFSDAGDGSGIAPMRVPNPPCSSDAYVA